MKYSWECNQHYGESTKINCGKVMAKWRYNRAYSIILDKYIRINDGYR